MSINSMNRAGRGREALEQFTPLQIEHEELTAIQEEQAPVKDKLTPWEVLLATVEDLDVNQSLFLLEAYNDFYNNPSRESLKYAVDKTLYINQKIRGINVTLNWFNQSQFCKTPEYQEEMMYILDVLVNIQTEITQFVGNLE
ncbi:hypothetical protein [Klebsiella variicola]|uniref:hypothetical protein n=1 Tax=Klebsiella variicola TaxID=244366 RepID=UPI0028BD01FA|nr:hypothetical protein [Klebsiella variicola]MDT7005050.1 hypothetical protein [Klebsiella variicola]MDT7027991.1 hypothetical protein [Klebsiella variicola]